MEFKVNKDKIAEMIYVDERELMDSLFKKKDHNKEKLVNSDSSEIHHLTEEDHEDERKQMLTNNT